MVTDFPLADILHNWDAIERISKWVVELGALTLDFKPQMAIKLQALAKWRKNQVEAPARALGDVLQRLTQAWRR
jgi:hypothetical protein